MTRIAAEAGRLGPVTENPRWFVRVATPDDIRAFRGDDYVVPPGFEAVVVDELDRDFALDWRLMPEDDVVRRCRWTENRVRCERSGVLLLKRGGYPGRLYAYCEQHTYGRHFEDGKLLVLILRPAGSRD